MGIMLKRIKIDGKDGWEYGGFRILTTKRWYNKLKKIVNEELKLR